MLGLLKEADGQTRLLKESAQREKDLAWREKYQQLQKSVVFNESLLRGKNTNQNIHKAADCSSNKLNDQKKLCDELINTNLEEIRLDNEREEKKRQLLWETAPELQNLRRMMLNAGVAKDQALQVAEKQALRQLEREEKKYQAEAASREAEEIQSESRKKEEEEREAKRKYRRELEELQQSKQTTDDEQLKKERAAIDEMKRSIEEEDRQRVKMKMEKQNEMRRQMLELQKLREDMKLRQKTKENMESLKVAEYGRAQELRAKKLEEKKQLELQERLQVQEELLQFLEKSCREKLEREQLRTELAIEERELGDKDKTMMEELKRKKVREDLQRVYEMQLQLKRQKEDLLKKEDEIFLKKLMEKLYEEDKLEQMGMQRRRQKQLQHKRAVQAMLVENRQKKVSEKAREMADTKYLEQLEAARAEMVNEERIRFLKEHAPGLMGYLPKGIFRDYETIELLGDDIKKCYPEGKCPH